MIEVKHRPEAAKTIISSVTWKGTGECDTHLAVFDHERDEIIQTIIIPDHYMMAFDLSPDGRMAAASFWKESPQVRIWDLTSGEQIRIFSSFGVSGIYFDKTSRYVLYKSERGTYAKEIFGDASLQILYVEDVRSGSFSRTDNTFWVPVKRRGTLVCLTFAPLTQHTLQLPIPTVINQLCHSPTTDTFFALDGKKTVHSFVRLYASLASRYGQRISRAMHQTGMSRMVSIAATAR